MEKKTIGMREETLPQLLFRNAIRYGSKTAQREKLFGIWQPLSWQEYLEQVRLFALGLAALGFHRGDKLALIGENHPQWVWAELAAQALGGVAVGLYHDSMPQELAYIIDHSDAVMVVAEDQEQVDKMMEIKERIPRVGRIIFYNAKGLNNYSDELLLSFTTVQEMGRRFGDEHPSFFENVLDKGRAGDVAILSYTSGTTGMPKGAMLTHNNLIRMAANLLSLDPLGERDEFLSFLPLAWIGEQMMAISAALWSGMTVNFPEKSETVQQDLKEIGPHVMFSPPRIWEDMASRVQARVRDADWLKRTAYRVLMPIGQRMADCRFHGRRAGWGLRCLYFVADLFLFAAIRDHLGMSRLKYAYTGGAALGPELFVLFHALDINLKQIYGQTEIAGISVAQRNGAVKFHTVGEPIPETKVRISAEGEIISRSPSVFLGYYKDKEATAIALSGGWLHSGDAGYIGEDGHLVVIDRLKDVIRLVDRSMFSPQLIETKLKFSPYIKEAVAVGRERPFVTALLNIDMGSVGKWAGERQIPYTTYADLAAKPEVLDLLAREVTKINQHLPDVGRVRRFVVLHKELDADDEELTRTRKVRRGFVAQKYAAVVNALYDGRSTVQVETTMRYSDGRDVSVATELEIVSVPDAEVKQK